jgi:succinylglutamate desuccinylase
MKPTYDEIKRLFGDVNDHTIAEIENSGATMPELQEVADFLAQETDVMGDLHRTLSGRGVEIYNLLRKQDARWEEDR